MMTINQNSQDGTEEFYTLAELTALLKISRTTLWRCRRNGKLTEIRLGSCIRVRKSDLLNYFTEQANAKKPAGNS